MNTTLRSVVPDHVPDALVVDFDAYNPPGVDDDLQQAFTQFQSQGHPDLVWCTGNGGHWMPTSGALVAEMWADHKRFSNRLAILPKEFGLDQYGIPQSLDPPDHTEFRRSLNLLLSPRAVKDMEGEVRAKVVAMIDEIRGRGRCEFVNDFALVLPVYIFLNMAGLPSEDRVQLQQLNDHIIRPASATLSIKEASEQLHNYLRAPVVERIGKGGDDLFSQMINRPVFGRRMTADEAVLMAKLVLQGGIDTVSNLMSFVMHFLASTPDKRAELVDAPELIPVAVEEFARRFPVVETARLVREDMVYQGVEMRAGDPVLLVSHFHGLDERENKVPLECDFHRQKRLHSTFGQGVHHCPGALLARLEMRVTLEEWLKRIPDFRLAEQKIQCRAGVVGGMNSLHLEWDV
jgi:camphor 5-monooxygenase